jgi:hypothetical protein
VKPLQAEVHPIGNFNNGYVRVLFDGNGFWITVGNDHGESEVWVSSEQLQPLVSVLSPSNQSEVSMLRSQLRSAEDGRTVDRINADWSRSLKTQRDELLTELQNIANANPSDWGVDLRDQFTEWAQSRARHAVAKAETARLVGGL